MTHQVVCPECGHHHSATICPVCKVPVRSNVFLHPAMSAVQARAVAASIGGRIEPTRRINYRVGPPEAA